MRFRLRTLLILLAVLPPLLGYGYVRWQRHARIAYLKQMAKSHRSKVAELVQKLATPADPVHEQQVKVERLASQDRALRIRSRSETDVNICLDNGGGGLIWENKNAADDWCAAVFHEVMANRYDRAAYRPWTVVSEPAIPPEK